MISTGLILAAFIAGLLMFLAPCTLPIVPGYLAFIAGAPTGREVPRRRIVWNAIAFVVGFSVVYVTLGVSAGLLGSFIDPWKVLFSRIGGGVFILFGLTMLGALRIPFVSAELHLRLPKFIAVGKWQSSLLIGILFALGWSPCIGPILAGILFLAAHHSALEGAFLLSIFSLGMGTPFILTALLLDSAQNMFGKWAKTSQILSSIGGAVLVLVGILMLTGTMGLMVQWGFQFFEAPYSQLLKYM